jgi:hypothetical protein
MPSAIRRTSISIMPAPSAIARSTPAATSPPVAAAPPPPSDIAATLDAIRMLVEREI